MATERRNRDAEIAEAAIKLFYEKGYAESSIQDVADSVGLLKGSVYHYISSKEDLLFRILKESHAQARAIMDDVIERDGSAADRLREFLERMYTWYLGHIERASLYFNQRECLTGEKLAAVLAEGREFEQFVRDLLSEAKSEGSLRQDLEVKLGAFFILGALNSIPLWYKPKGSYSPKRITAEFVELSMNSLTAGAALNSGAGDKIKAARRA